MNISENLEKMANRKDRERGEQNINRLFKILYHYDVTGLDEVLSQIKELSESELYVKIINVVPTDRRAPGTKKGTFKEGSQVRLLNAARGVLSFGGLWTNLFANSLISLRDLSLLHVYIESVYCINKRKLNKWNDYLNIYFSGLDEKIIFTLDQFDKEKIGNIPEPTPEYFQSLKRVRWNKKAKELYDNLEELMEEITSFVLNYPNLTHYVKNVSEYKAIEELFIQLLAGCSAVNNGRLEIEAEDVIIAYKTLFKLIKTDVTKYKAIPERIHGLSRHDEFLVCQKCGGYYQLEPGESMDDFECLCNCGGRLEYKTTLED